jgi:hypothetical protein
MATNSGKPAGFVGQTGPGAEINLYLPQPGQHVGRRIIKIEDIPEQYFLDTAKTAGTPWSEQFGVIKRDDLWDIIDPEKFTSNWLGRYSRTRGIKPARLGRLRSVLNVSARAALQAQGSLVSWSRGGAATAARQLSAPDDTGSSDPLPSNLPEPDDGKPDRTPPEQDAGEGIVGSLAEIATGVLYLPTEGWGGTQQTTPVDLEEPPTPTFFIVQVVGISSFLDDYGLGKTVKTFTLLPGETTNIHTRTWRATEESISQGSSIIDSYDESAAERFAETVLSETTDTATREQTENWYVDAEAGGSIGIASANVSGGGGGEYSSSTEEFAKSLDEAVREHTSEASSHRENTVTSSSESSVSTEEEEVIERTISNINVSRVLNFTFRELNQAYHTISHLKDIRIAFANGNAGSWREEPISSLRRLVEAFIQPQHVNKVCRDIIATIALVRNVDETPVRVLEQVVLNPCGTDFHVRDAEPNRDCQYPAPRADGRLYYRFKRGPLAQAPDTVHPVDGVVLSERTVIMATDSVVVEALLGTSPALDAYSEQLQLEAIREKRLANEREELAQGIVKSARSAEAGLFDLVFGENGTEPEPEEAVVAS